MRTAIVCNTPLQIMGALDIVANNICDTKNKTDLFLIMSFRDSDIISENINKTNLFNHVYRIKPNKKKITSLFDLLSYKKILSSYDFEDNSFLNNKYSNLFVGDKNLLGVALNYKNKCESVYIYDDGINSYKGNCIIDYNSYKYPFISKLLKTDVLSYKIKKLFVYNKEYCHSSISNEIEQLPQINKNNNVYDILFNVFNYNEETDLKKHRIIILDQPLEKKKNFNGLTFYEILNKIQINNPLIRLHPVQKNVNYGQYKVDKVNNLWELECIKNLSNNHILLSFYSTAQFSPKFISDKEPYVFFLYKLFISDYGTKEYEEFENMIKVLKDSYKTKDKIYVPKNLEELNYLLKEISS